jgi:hypothetical protein
MPNVKKNYPTLSDMKAANPGFFNKTNKSFFGDRKYRAYHGYLIVEGTTPHSDGSKSKRISVYRFAPELDTNDPFHYVTLRSGTSNLDKIKELISKYEKNEWPEKAARIAESIKNQN